MKILHPHHPVVGEGEAASTANAIKRLERATIAASQKAPVTISMAASESGR